MSRLIDLTKQVFGRLTVLHRSNIAGKRVKWHCLCTCGNTSDVDGTKLRSGETKSCGCLSRELTSVRSKANATHGRTRTKIYRTWKCIKNRCLNPKADQWKNYGGRGIQICDRWLKFENFLEDMGEPPDGHSIERIDVNGNYEPSNCKWIPVREQQYNKRNSVKLTFNSKTMTIAEWSRELGINEHVIRQRIKLGWTAEAALTTPVDHRFGKAKEITFQGETKSLAGWASAMNLTPTALDKRLRKGWELEKALTTPLKTNYGTNRSLS